ncbi:MAG TPA: hypothetical protein VHS79_00980 [Actinomycetes bacterium]|nr:hypothetical protein [Actinomycetes bacterium]
MTLPAASSTMVVSEEPATSAWKRRWSWSRSCWWRAAISWEDSSIKRSLV